MPTPIRRITAAQFAGWPAGAADAQDRLEAVVSTTASAKPREWSGADSNSESRSRSVGPLARLGATGKPTVSLDSRNAGEILRLIK